MAAPGAFILLMGIACSPMTPIAIDGTGALPMGAVVSPDGRELYVSTGRGNCVAIVDLKTNKHIATIAVGARPWGIALSPDGTVLYTANGASDDVSVIDVRGRKEMERIKVGAGPWGIAVVAHQPDSSSNSQNKR